MRRPSQAKKEYEMIREMLRMEPAANNPDLMLALPDGTLLSQQEETALNSSLSLLSGLGCTTASRRQQVHMDATALLRALCSQSHLVPERLSEKSQQYGLSIDGKEFSRVALAYAKFGLTYTEDGIRLHTVKTTIAPAEFQDRKASTR